MSHDTFCLYTLLHAPAKNNDTLLRELVAPVVRQLDGAPEIESFFFARYSEPDDQLRFRVLGRPEFVESRVRPLVEESLAREPVRGLYERVEFASYEREWDRYGGEVGMPLAEAIFAVDSRAALELLDAESRGALSRTRREWSVLFTDRFLDLFEFDRAAKIDFYRFSHSWAIRDGDWSETDVRALEAKYDGVRAALGALVLDPPSFDAARWGGEEAARIAERALEATRPLAARVLSGLRDGSIPQDPIYLVWSYTHMHANRLGIGAVAEAIVRYFLWRLHKDAFEAAQPAS